MDFRREWLATLVAQCQTSMGSVFALRHTDELVQAAAALVIALPDPQCEAEDLALRAILIDVAVKVSSTVHNRAHRGAKQRTCAFVTNYGLDRFGVRTRRTAKQRFEDWARVFSEEFARTHARSAAQRVAVMIRTDAHARLSVTRLASLVGVTPASLRRTFRRERGLALPEYLRRLRLLRALDVLVQHGGKIEPIALEAGYRSKKNFYSGCRQLTGLTPAVLRRLPATAARKIVESMRLALYARSRSATRAPARMFGRA